MTFPLFILLVPYLLFLVFWLFFSGVAVYHMFKFGFKNVTTIFTTVLYVAIAGSILIVSLFYIASVDWNTKVTIFENLININQPVFGL